MKKTAYGFIGLIFCFVFVSAVSAPPAFSCGHGDDGDCHEINTGGNVEIDAAQYQHYFSGMTGDNAIRTTNEAKQTTGAYGQGDRQTTVSAQGQMTQYERYNVDTQMPLGETRHFGESFMGVYGSAGTGEWCRSLGIAIENGREAATNTSMTESSMQASIGANAYLDAHIEGAKDTTGFAAASDQITGYSQERLDGSWQQGSTRTIIGSGTLPQ